MTSLKFKFYRLVLEHMIHDRDLWFQSNYRSVLQHIIIGLKNNE